VAVVGCQAEMIDQDGRSEGFWIWPLGNLVTKLALFRYETPFLHPCVMFRRDDAMVLGGYDEALPCIQDRDFWWKFADRGRFCHLPDVLLRYRKHATQITTARRDEQVRLGIEITKKYGALYGFSTAELDCFSRIDFGAESYNYRSVHPSADELETYVGVLNRILRMAAERWDVDDVEIDWARRIRWRFLAKLLSIHKPPTRKWLRCLRALHHLAPGDAA
jgi:hypothetical protein